MPHSLIDNLAGDVFVAIFPGDPALVPDLGDHKPREGLSVSCYAR